MKKHLTTIFLLLVFLVGLSVLLYPSLSDYWNSFTQSRVVLRYEDNVSKLSDRQYDSLLAEAREYNQRLAGRYERFNMSDSQLKEYNSTFDANGDGVIGIIEIPKIDVRLPIYHGTKDSVLQVGVGHLEGSSFPVGGKGSHAVLTGHRGLPSAQLLSRLDKMETGDRFKLTVLNEILTYEVDQITIVLPEDLSGLEIDPDGDYITLITCTPYGVNSHRMLVRGVRAANDAQPLNLRVSADARRIDAPLAAPACIALMLIIMLVYMLIKYKSRKGGS